MEKSVEQSEWELLLGDQLEELIDTCEYQAWWVAKHYKQCSVMSRTYKQHLEHFGPSWLLYEVTAETEWLGPPLGPPFGAPPRQGREQQVNFTIVLTSKLVSVPYKIFTSTKRTILVGEGLDDDE